MNNDLISLWQQGDIITQGVAITLALMSISSWSIIATKCAKLFGISSQHRTSEKINQFWEASNLTEGKQCLKKLTPFIYLVEQAHQAKQHYVQFHIEDHDHALDAGMSLNELVTKALRQSLSRLAVQMDRGQIVLASIGSTAPFIGLLGTVWGIYHALIVIGASGQATLDTVAGPVGEALIMTAFGLLVAIPSVLSYNAFNRAQRLIMSDLDGFAHDLQLFFSINKDA